MRLEPGEARTRFEAARVLRLATSGRGGQPHLVPCTFVLDTAGRVVIGIDHKPKTTLNLRRLQNIAENPKVSVLADDYDDDWNRLWWSRADGTATIERDGAEHRAHWHQLRTKYRQYDRQDLDGPVIAITPGRWSGWAYSPPKEHGNDSVVAPG
jgi:PPOX class probable F420-dependent enzyme